MSDIETISAVPTLPARDRDGHKGTYGTVLVVGGSRRMIGAPALSASAALRGGAGLVTIATPKQVQLAVAMLCECATSIPLDSDAMAVPLAGAPKQLREAAERADVLAVGPGMGQSSGTEQLLRVVLDQPKPVVLDADGLNLLAKIDNWAEIRRCPLVLTPHPGEFARLTGQAVADFQADRQTAAVDFVRNNARDGLDLVLVLKGAGTVITDGQRAYVNATGNPGMATGGSGDVLTGLIAALLAQGQTPLDAACQGVYVHGLAGDRAAEALTEPALTATDLLDYIPDALRTILAPKDAMS